MYMERFYRKWMGRDHLSCFKVQIQESDLLIHCDRCLEQEANVSLAEVRQLIENHIASDYGFKTSLDPLAVPEGAPPVIRAMASAAKTWGVGPMAAVAGAVAEFVGRSLLSIADLVIVENGGDIFAQAPETIRFALYAGEASPFSDKLAFEVDATEGVGVCTSSARIGPSLSLGQADAVVAIAANTAEADAAATSIANKVQRPEDVDLLVERVRHDGALKGIIACAGDRLGLWGDLEIVQL